MAKSEEILVRLKIEIEHYDSAVNAAERMYHGGAVTDWVRKYIKTYEKEQSKDWIGQLSMNEVADIFGRVQDIFSGMEDKKDESTKQTGDTSEGL